MGKFEMRFEVEHEQAKAALTASAAFVKRSQVEDVLFAGDGGRVARLRRQDTVTRLSCLAPDGREAPETIVLDFPASLKLLARFGFRETARDAFGRETWKRHHYLLHLDRFGPGTTRLTVEAEAWSPEEARMRRQASSFLKSIGIRPPKRPNRRLSAVERRDGADASANGL